ncbi:hypothetical protein PR048_005699 [Dryococelus australis]|uniref:Transposase n=1 Tax=Dryococelus australis TaxID=614101 RepID=A0ABQ9I925_9NEOP|nr:hypothetical protein PR048_005699 [Dryococelus australis]
MDTTGVQAVSTIKMTVSCWFGKFLTEMLLQNTLVEVQRYIDENLLPRQDIHLFGGRKTANSLPTCLYWLGNDCVH